MAGDVLLDTSVVVSHLRQDIGIAKRLKAAGVLWVSFVTVGELYYGTRRSIDPKKAMAGLEDFLGLTSVMVGDEATGREYGLIKQELRQKGMMIPDNDIWIAALARQNGVALAHRDEHFQSVSGIELLNW
jgi:tRNA(fMet)-specific endonuclease VapC